MNCFRRIALIGFWIGLMGVGGFGLGLSSSSASDSLSSGGVEFFEKRVRPLLAARCQECHGSAKQKGGLRLDSVDAMLEGGDSGPAIVPGEPEISLLIRAIGYADLELQMPPKNPLPENEKALLTQWVKEGAPAPRKENRASRTKEMDIEAGRNFWAYQPLQQPEVPSVKRAELARNEVDAFLLAALERRGAAPAEAEAAAPEVLARRVYFDLTGLPPTPEQIEELSGMRENPRVWEMVVDRLLASPRFGERWGRRWLDVARFGESVTLRGMIFKEAWRYRDYVIDAFNRDLPFNEFVREQIAGDLLPNRSLEERRRGVIAAGFLALGNTVLEEQDKAQLRMDVVDEQLDAIGKAFLAQTLGCARCHDHKFDPIPTEDYYALAGILRNTKTLVHANVSNWIDVPLPLEPQQEAALRAHEKTAAELQAEIKKAKEAAKAPAGAAGADGAGPVGDVAGAATEDQEARRKAAQDLARRLEAELKRLLEEGPKRPMALSVLEETDIGDARVHVRGSVHNLGRTAPRGFLRVAAAGPAPEFSTAASGRLELAEWLASPSNPLTARVFVNRVWGWVFGTGLVSTPDNFGRTGEPPSHPELLDFLTRRFIEQGWSVKRLVRDLMSSRAYQLSSAIDPAGAELDPENRFLWRMNRRRLDAESIRDAMLQTSGTLRLEMGGPTVIPPSNSDYGYVDTDSKRSVYTPAFRNAPPELFQVFDGADPSVVTGQRSSSTAAPQALFLMNHPFVLRQSELAAETLLGDASLRTDEDRLERACRQVLGRSPLAGERRLAWLFLGDGSPIEPRERASDRNAWAAIYQALFASIDFRFLK